MISCVQLAQIFVYDNTKTGEKRKIVMWPVFLIMGEWIFVLTMFFIELSGKKVDPNIQFLRVAGYCKALITFVKYMP